MPPYIPVAGMNESIIRSEITGSAHQGLNTQAGADAVVVAFIHPVAADILPFSRYLVSNDDEIDTPVLKSFVSGLASDTRVPPGNEANIPSTFYTTHRVSDGGGLFL